MLAKLAWGLDEVRCRIHEVDGGFIHGLFSNAGYPILIREPGQLSRLSSGTSRTVPRDCRGTSVTPRGRTAKYPNSGYFNSRQKFTTQCFTPFFLRDPGPPLGSCGSRKIFPGPPYALMSQRFPPSLAPMPAHALVRGKGTSRRIPNARRPTNFLAECRAIDGIVIQRTGVEGNLCHPGAVTHHFAMAVSYSKSRTPHSTHGLRIFSPQRRAG